MAKNNINSRSTREVGNSKRVPNRVETSSTVTGTARQKGRTSGVEVPETESDFQTVPQRTAAETESVHFKKPSLSTILAVVVSMLSFMAGAGWYARGITNTLDDIQANVKEIKEKVGHLTSEVWKVGNRQESLEKSVRQNERVKK